MKQVSIASLLLIAAFPVMAQQPFTIQGKLTAVKDAKIMLEYREGKKRVSDSAIIQNGKFSFKGTVANPVKASITVKALNDDGVFSLDKLFNRDDKEFYIEKGAITINGATA